MSSVSLISFAGCPHAGAARAHLLRAFVAAGVGPRWTEHEPGAPELPADARGYGSPTILVDGKDVMGMPPGGSPEACRVYPGEGAQLTGVPPVGAITAALRSRRGRWGLSSLGTVPGLAIALLPKLACPACWPAYAGILGALGLGFLADTAWLLPLTAGFLLLATLALGHRCRQRRGPGPLMLGLVADVLILGGKFAVERPLVFQGGVLLLLAASVWNAWPRRELSSGASCASCAPGASGTFQPVAHTRE